MEISDDTISENQSEENIQEQDEEELEDEELDKEQLEEKSIEIIEEEVIKEVKETEENKREEIDESIATFLREKGLSENLVKTLINAGLTDEHIRLTEIDKLHSYFSYINQNCNL